MKKSKGYSSLSEKKAFRDGLFAGLRKAKKRKVSSKNVGTKKVKPKNNKWYSFLAFNNNGDIFNVEAYDSSRSAALRQARSKLKRDPEMPCWGVEITNDNGSREYYRTVTVDDNIKGGVSDNWKRYYRESDNDIRLKYGKDLSKPLHRKKS